MKNFKKIALCTLAMALAAPLASLPQVHTPSVAIAATVQSTVSHQKLALGEVTIYNYGGIKLHAINTKDVLADECYVLESKDGLVLLESSAFKANVQEINDYIKSLNKPLEGIFLSYHSNGYNAYGNAPIYATESAVASWGDNGGVKVLTDNFVQVFGDAVDTNLPQQATIVKTGDTVTVAGIDFRILPTMDEDYSLEIPAINTVYRHMLGSDVHNILPNIAYIDGEIADMKAYQKKGYELILTSHYVPEGQEAVATKLSYLEKVKELALANKDKADFITAMKSAFPNYLGDNYLQMTADALYR
ncbi:MAG: hypothetical protein K6C05_09510 [Anaerovibrio sp.]|uniref:hypothetical protein n=1 Tax=Anaerovibrio sp. TaxID=1872532 RepID=UPI0025FA8EF1|nr:hypothetical protein [Anaerovibrio sp.]MCR5177069.1 hypothetical protein [Anaerovibrio sp.]